MSVAREGAGWWQASDGRWYPPEQNPGWQVYVPPPQPEYRAPGTPDPDEVKKKSDELPSFFNVVPEEMRNHGASNATGLVTVNVDTGHSVEVLIGGVEHGIPLLFHHGTPFATTSWPAAVESATRHGIQFISWSRPGYGASTRVPGRSVADVALEAEAVLASLDQDRFLTLGWSGGAPYALACASLFGDRCLAAATIGCEVPPTAEGITRITGFHSDRAEETVAANHGGSMFEEYLEHRLSMLPLESTTDVVTALGSPLSPVDISALSDGLGETLLRSLRRASSSGIAGWYDDDVALAGEWGFTMTSIRVPVAVCHGGEDELVSPAHGNWFVEHLPNGHRRWLHSEGHISPLRLLDNIFDDLLRLAGVKDGVYS